MSMRREAVAEARELLDAVSTTVYRLTETTPGPADTATGHRPRGVNHQTPTPTR
jgi:hypothetical protein